MGFSQPHFAITSPSVPGQTPTERKRLHSACRRRGLSGRHVAGLNSTGVTLELGGLWDASTPAAVPPSAGTLCTLRISEAAQVSVTANASRGGVVSASPGVSISPIFYRGVCGSVGDHYQHPVGWWGHHHLLQGGRIGNRSPQLAASGQARETAAGHTLTGSRKIRPGSIVSITISPS